jgi:cobalt/nickel transport system permease protein
LLGAGIAAVLLGTLWGSVSLTLVLAIQALAMGDGGVTALGANVLNMAIVGVVAGSAARAAYRNKNEVAAASAAGFVSTFAASAACAAELAISGVGSLRDSAGSIVAPHLLVALAEGMFTAALVWATARRSEPSGRRIAWAPLVAAAVIVAALVPMASSQPDTLEATLETHSK